MKNTMQIKYKNPNKVKGFFTWKADIKFLPSSDVKSKLDTDLNDSKLLQKLVQKYGDKLYFISGDGNNNKFFIWFSQVKEWKNQKNVRVNYSIQPNKRYSDGENNNLIDFFNFSKKLNKRFKLKINFTLKVYETKLSVNSINAKKYDKKSFLYKRYTQSEKYLEQTKEIKKLAKNIVGKEKDYFKMARKIFDWVTANITYKYPPEERGIIPALKNKCGDCGEFSFVFIGLSRSIGIPARFVSGMWTIPGKNQGFHAWAEFYLEDIGWIPVDCSMSRELKTKKDKKLLKFIKKLGNSMDSNYYFGNLDNKRIIFSKGNNILLKNCPKELSKLEMMGDCRSLFMQPDAIYPFISGKQKGIFILDINRELTIL